jgi:hypothetical protein
MKGSALMIEAAQSIGDDDDDQPIAPSPLARHVGLLKAAVYIMGVMLVVGTILLVAAIVWKASRLPGTAATGAGSFEDFDIAVPPGASVHAIAIDGDRMAVTLEGERREIVIIDIRRGEVLGRIGLTTEAVGSSDR